MKSKKNKSDIDLFDEGQNHLKHRRYSAALDSYTAAIKKAPRNYQYIRTVSDLLKNMAFQEYSLERKNLVFTCLKTPNINYEDLWRVWYSVIMCSPLMKDFQGFVKGEAYDSQKLRKSLKDSFFLEGLKKTIVFDMSFESALQKLHKDIQSGEGYPREFVSALDVYCLNTEYIFCDEAPDRGIYPIDSSIETLSVSDDKVSKVVRQQYEENPYPRWISAETEVMYPERTHDHLIAGCGTGYSTCMTAMIYPNANIMAIDLSLASLSYAKRKAKELGITNVTFYQADILSLEKLDQKFDIIECSGVLHHMDDPVKGWKALMSKLKPDGKMHIGLYSEIGRQDVVAARKIVAEQGFDATHHGIAQAREYIVNLSEEDAAYPLSKRRDFYTTSSCRDLVFHVQEHRFTLLQLRDILQELGLEFERFNIEGKQVLTSYKKQYGGGESLTNLENWHAFEQKKTDTFKGMYQFWCSKK